MLKIAIRLYRKHFTEAIKGILFGFISIVIFIIGFSVYRVHTSEISRIAKNLRIAVIVDQNLTDNDILVLKNKISNIRGIKNTDYTDPEKSRDHFLRRNRIDKNAIFLDSFPRLIFASLEEDYYHSGRIFYILNRIYPIQGVNEIVYDKDGFNAFNKYRNDSIFSGVIILCVILSLMLFYGISLYNGQKRIYQMNFDVLSKLGYSKWSSVLPLVVYEYICLLIGLALGLTVFLIIWYSLESHYFTVKTLALGSVPMGILITIIFSASLIFISNLFFRTSQINSKYEYPRQIHT
jgi:hypothetical protein